MTDLDLDQTGRHPLNIVETEVNKEDKAAEGTQKSDTFSSR